MTEKQTYWYQNAVIYELYTRAFFDSNGDGQGDLDGIRQKLDYLKDLGIDCIWLLPVYSSPLKDGGYDISDFCNLHPSCGTLDDFKALVEAAHQHGMRIIMDLVLNHTSDQHPWFQAARADRYSPYRDYYVWNDTDQKFKDARIIFLDTEKSNWTWDEKAGQYYWHRFYASQPDLNYENPVLRAEILHVIDFWLSFGIDGFRADAVPYLFEREGTNCENLPETHAFLKEIRRFVDEHYPDRALLCEANQWPRDVRTYLGAGDEFQLAFQFPLMPRIYMALRKEDYTPIRWALEQTPPIPENCQWCTFLRNHDELTLEMVTEEERQWMWKEYAPEVGMRLNLGIRRRLAPLLDNDKTKILLAYSLLFSLPGSPVLYYGDEIGMGDDLRRPDRDGLRSPMQWDSTYQAGFTTSNAPYAEVISNDEYGPKWVNAASELKDPQSLLSTIKKMIQVRRAHPVFATGDLTDLEGLPVSVAGFSRSGEGERLIILNNLSSEAQPVRIPCPDGCSSSVTDLLTNREFQIEGGGLSLRLQPHEYCWLKL